MAELTEPTEIREAVRRRYAAAASAAPDDAGCCESSISTTDRDGRHVFGPALYADSAHAEAGAALEASLGCGNPTAVAELHHGETVLDLGSGAGGDVLLSAHRVGPTGRAIGLDMTDERRKPPVGLGGEGIWVLDESHGHFARSHRCTKGSPSRVSGVHVVLEAVKPGPHRPEPGPRCVAVGEMPGAAE